MTEVPLRFRPEWARGEHNVSERHLRRQDRLRQRRQRHVGRRQVPSSVVAGV